MRWLAAVVDASASRVVVVSWGCRYGRGCYTLDDGMATHRARATFASAAKAAALRSTMNRILERQLPAPTTGEDVPPEPRTTNGLPAMVPVVHISATNMYPGGKESVRRRFAAPSARSYLLTCLCLSMQGWKCVPPCSPAEIVLETDEWLQGSSHCHMALSAEVFARDGTPEPMEYFVQVCSVAAALRVCCSGSW